MRALSHAESVKEKERESEGRKGKLNASVW